MEWLEENAYKSMVKREIGNKQSNFNNQYLKAVIYLPRGPGTTEDLEIKKTLDELNDRNWQRDWSEREEGNFYYILEADFLGTI